MIGDELAPDYVPLPPRMPKGHPANLLRAEIKSAQPRAHKVRLVEFWWSRYGDEYAIVQKESATRALAARIAARAHRRRDGR